MGHRYADAEGWTAASDHAFAAQREALGLLTPVPLHSGGVPLTLPSRSRAGPMSAAGTSTAEITTASIGGPATSALAPAPPASTASASAPSASVSAPPVPDVSAILAERERLYGMACTRAAGGRAMSSAVLDVALKWANAKAVAWAQGLGARGEDIQAAIAARPGGGTGTGAGTTPTAASSATGGASVGAGTLAGSNDHTATAGTSASALAPVPVPAPSITSGASTTSAAPEPAPRQSLTKHERVETSEPLASISSFLHLPVEGASSSGHAGSTVAGGPVGGEVSTTTRGKEEQEEGGVGSEPQPPAGQQPHDAAADERAADANVPPSGAHSGMGEQSSAG